MIPEITATTTEEITQFMRLLTTERTYYDVESTLITATSAFVQGARVSGELVGIGGITRSYGLLYSTFYIVRSDWQGKGIGGRLATGNHDYARRRNLHLLVTVVAEANVAATRIPRKFGYRLLTKHCGQAYLCITFDVLGRLVGATLLPIIIRLYLSPLGDVLRAVRKRKYKEAS